MQLLKCDTYGKRFEKKFDVLSLDRITGTQVHTQGALTLDVMTDM